MQSVFDSFCFAVVFFSFHLTLIILLFCVVCKQFYLEVLLLQLVKIQYFKWHLATSQEELVTQLCADLPLLDIAFIFPESRSSEPPPNSPSFYVDN